MNGAFDRVCALLEPFGLRMQGDRGRSACPGHSGLNRSALSVGVGSEGQVLMRCWSGCDIQEIVSGLGLELHDLFPPRESSRTTPMTRRRMLSAMQGLELVHDEAEFAAYTLANIGHGMQLTQADRDRAFMGYRRIAFVLREVRS